MSTSQQGDYRKWFLAGLAAVVLAAWFSVGFNHPDEHFQVLEFANYKLFHTPAADLPWEFQNQCRSALQPAMAYCIWLPLVWLHCYSPTMAVFLLRLLIGVAMWFTTCRVVLRLLPSFGTRRGKLMFVAAAMLLWYVPYIGVRFSSENLAALLFLWVFLLLPETGGQPNNKLLRYLGAGVLCGLMLFVRLQMVFALGGAAVWLAVVSRTRWTAFAAILVGTAAGMALAVLADYWFYGMWVISPYNYYHVNMVRNMAAKWGTDPWWNYFNLFFQSAVPPLSLVLMLCFGAGVRRHAKHVFSFAVMAFLAGHFLIAHKEMRFLFPMALPFLFLAASGAEWALERYSRFGRPMRWVWKTLVAVNMVVLVYRIFTPAQEVISYYGFVSRYAGTRKTTLVYFSHCPYLLNDVRVHFYQPSNVAVRHIHSHADLEAVVHKPESGTVLYISPGIKLGHKPAGFRLEKLYCLFPDFVLKCNIGNWQERSHIYSVYRVGEMR
jgi:GPI mannosyltransferase 3